MDLVYPVCLISIFCQENHRFCRFSFLRPPVGPIKFYRHQQPYLPPFTPQKRCGNTAVGRRAFAISPRCDPTLKLSLFGHRYMATSARHQKRVPASFDSHRGAGPICLPARSAASSSSAARRHCPIATQSGAQPDVPPHAGLTTPRPLHHRLRFRLSPGHSFGPGSETDPARILRR
jgi:hypothetical protein